MANELIINASLPETRIALIEDGEIQELLIERASGKGIVGNVYKGKVTRVLPGMQAAFVDIGLEKAAFLYVDDVYVHSELWEEEEGDASSSEIASDEKLDEKLAEEVQAVEAPPEALSAEAPVASEAQVPEGHSGKNASSVSAKETSPDIQAWAGDLSHESTSNPLSESSKAGASEALDSEESEHFSDELDDLADSDESEDSDEDSGNPQSMGPDSSDPSDTVAPPSSQSETKASESKSDAPSEKSSKGMNEGAFEVSGEVSHEASTHSSGDSVGETSAEGSLEGSEDSSGEAAGEGSGEEEKGEPRRRHRRSRRGSRFKKQRGPVPVNAPAAAPVAATAQPHYPDNLREQMQDAGQTTSDRSAMSGDPGSEKPAASSSGAEKTDSRAEFRATRSRDRRIRQKASNRPARPQVNIQDLLKEGQEVIVQVAKDPIATKGARLTCHISLPGRHLVCMPTIDHVGVSRRIERDDERRRLRDFVERNRPRNLGFIVRTASGRQQSEKRIKQDIDYLTHLWTEIREKAASVTAPALVYEDLNAVLRSVRDWVTEETDKVIVDSRYHFNEIQRFVSHFMPSIKQKVELYHGDIPIFDAYSISTELSRALERKVWLKSGGYIVIDQAEALVAIDVNTGRYVGKKNLEDTILKTNLEAVKEIAYQLRLRNCGGIIILDLIDMEKEENRQRVYRALEDALAKDRARPTILKISELGLIEMTRKRTRDTIIRSLCESCSHCEGKGFIKSKQTVAYEAMREIEREGIERDIAKILVQAHPDVIDILAIDERETVDQLERRYRKMIYLQAVTDFHPEQFEVTADKREKSEKTRETSRNDSPQPRKPIVPTSSSGVITPVSAIASSPSVSAQAVSAGGAAGGTVVVAVPASVPVIIPVSANVQPASIPVPVPVSSGVITPVSDIEPGNRALPVIEKPSASGNSTPSSQKNQQDEFFDEEDRLAFLRAQAAQDAALARLGTGGVAHPPRTSEAGAGRGGNTGGNGRRNQRGRRGGKFRSRNDRGRDRNSKSFGYNQGQPGQKWSEPSASESSADEGPRDSSDSDSSSRTPV